MSTTTAQMPANTKNPAMKQRQLSITQKRGSLSKRLLEIKANNENRFQFVDQSAQEIAESFNSIFAMLEFKDGGQTILREYRKDDMTPEELVAAASMLSIESQMDGSSRGQIAEGVENFMLMSCPLLCPELSEPKGALTIYVQVPDKEIGQKLLNSFETTINWLVNAVEEFDSVSSNDDAAPIKLDKKLESTGKGTKYENLTHLCMALSNNYCEKLGCEKAAIALVKPDNNTLELMAVSGMDSFKENSPPIIQLLQSQEECFDFGKPICVQFDEGTDVKAKRFLIHQKWHNESAGASVVSMPIQDDEKIVGVLSLQRNSDQPFQSEELEKIENSVSNFSGAIGLMRRAERTLKQHFVEDYLISTSKQLMKSTAAMIALAALAFVFFGWMPYKPTVPCVIEPSQVSRLVAPFDGVLQNVAFVPGDKVQQGQTVIQFDTRQLELAKESYQAQIKSKTLLRDQASAGRQTAEASILDAEIESLELQLESTLEKIASSKLTSSVDGHLVRGDLRQDVGQTITRGTALAEVAPIKGMRIKLHIPESKATHIEVGYTGYFVADSNPSDSRKFTVTSITPSTQVVDGINVVVAEASVDGDSHWMRSGMKGYAQVDAGWSPVVWIVGHGFWDSLRLGFWL